MHVEHPIAAAVLFCILILVLTIWQRMRRGSYLGYSSLKLWPVRVPVRQKIMTHIPHLFFFLIMLILFGALAQPKLQKPQAVEKWLTRDILLVIDMSNSMQMSLLEGAFGPSFNDPRRIDTAKKVASDFILKRNNDRFGLMIFGDDAFGVWPMTTDHPVILSKVAMLDEENGYDFLGATNLIKAISTGITYIEKDSNAAEPIMIFISDGEGSVFDGDLTEPIERLKKRNIHFFWILMGKSADPRGSPIDKIVAQLKFGRKFSAANQTEIEDALAQIDRVEKSRTVLQTSQNEMELFPQLCVLAAFFMVGAILMEGYRI